MTLWLYGTAVGSSKYTTLWFLRNPFVQTPRAWRHTRQILGVLPSVVVGATVLSAGPSPALAILPGRLPDQNRSLPCRFSGPLQ